MEFIFRWFLTNHTWLNSFQLNSTFSLEIFQIMAGSNQLEFVTNDSFRSWTIYINWIFLQTSTKWVCFILNSHYGFNSIPISEKLENVWKFKHFQTKKNGKTLKESIWIFYYSDFAGKIPDKLHEIEKWLILNTNRKAEIAKGCVCNHTNEVKCWNS